jgi:hypothetical protein
MVTDRDHVCASPAIWLMQSSFMLDILDTIASGMTMRGIQEFTPVLRQFMDGFVDDMANYANNKKFIDLSLETLKATPEVMARNGLYYWKTVATN